MAEPQTPRRHRLASAENTPDFSTESRTLDKSEAASAAARFIVWVTAAHVITYLLVGMVAAMLLDYERIFHQPVVVDYMIEFGSASVLLGPVIQVLRGALIAVVLLPFRSALAGARLGWLYLWLLLVGIGILSTSAAAPSSLEGVVYTRLPLWYHAIGLPEMLIQTLIFSCLVHVHLRHPAGLLSSAPAAVLVALRALAAASFAFIAYALVSVGFAILVGASVTASGNLSLRTQGLFVAPFLINTALVLIAPRVLTLPHDRWRLLLFGALVYGANALSLAAYQLWVLGGANLPYVAIAPIAPAVVVSMVSVRSARQALRHDPGPPLRISDEAEHPQERPTAFRDGR